MHTVTYQIRHWTDADTGCGDCFEVAECVTRHAVTGDEYEDCGVASFGDRASAEAFVAEIMAAL